MGQFIPKMLLRKQQDTDISFHAVFDEKITPTDEKMANEVMRRFCIDSRSRPSLLILIFQ